MKYFLLKLYKKLPLSPRIRFFTSFYVKKFLKGMGIGVGVGVRLLATPAVVALDEGATYRRKPAGGLKDYFFFGVIDWHFRHQRPQQLALSIAQTGRRVFYVSVNFEDSAECGYVVETLASGLGLYQIKFKVRGPLSIYAQQASPAQLKQLQEGLALLWVNAGTDFAVHVLQHPFWHALASNMPPARVVYDCMDYHAGFDNTAQAHEATELKMLVQSDLTVVTSDFLADFVKPSARRVALIRNAAEFAHFNKAASQVQKTDASPKSVIGYYGAIAEWFDGGLIRLLAEKFPDCEIQLVGDDSAGVGKSLADLPNVHFYGEKPYAELPQWLAGFDVCLIPFKVNALTLATNPVKVYEYLSAGKPVVSTALPELKQFGDLVYCASDAQGFLGHIKTALNERNQYGAAEMRQLRIEFVREQTWQKRATALVAVAENTDDEPSVSVVVVSYNQWHLTARCLASLEANSDSQSLEVIVVDNGSKDETPTQLQLWAAKAPMRRRVIANEGNLGFGGAVNQGLAAATGDFLVILNNDTIVSPGWARGLRRHLENNPKLGIICPITNNIGNEAQVVLQGTTPAEVFASAKHYSLAKAGHTLPLTIAAFFCVMMPRAVYARIGNLDEQFFPGYFEDDDYCLRAKEAGWTIACAEDVFVYHELSASFNKEGAARRLEIFTRNKGLFEAKWGAWTPHVYR
jgi:GT2 family glycosyltransferase/glycosyltransferase involved in cell wall biosynthesis